MFYVPTGQAETNKEAAKNKPTCGRFLLVLQRTPVVAKPNPFVCIEQVDVAFLTKVFKWKCILPYDILLQLSLGGWVKVPEWILHRDLGDFRLRVVDFLHCVLPPILHVLHQNSHPVVVQQFGCQKRNQGHPVVQQFGCKRSPWITCSCWQDHDCQQRAAHHPRSPP